MRQNAKKILILLSLAGFFVFAGFRVWEAYKIKQAADAAKPAARGAGPARVVSVSVTQAREGSVRDEIQITGSLKPKESVDVTSKITGRVEKLTVQVGDYVKRGDLIASLDDAELEQQVRRAEAALGVVRATLQQREAELSNAKADLDRAKQLTQGGLISRQEYDTKLTSFRVVQSQIALAQAQREQAEAELRELKIQLEQMKIQSPISGYIAQRYVDSGAVISPSTPIARVVNLSTMVTLANVPEGDISRLRIGNRAIVTVDAYGEKPFEGRIARISPVLDAATRTALVEVEIPNSNAALKAEMFARVKLDMGSMRETVLIPREALVYRGQQAGVYVVDAKRPSFKSVETGINHGQQVEVVSNLAAGTTIVGRGAAMLNEGDEIRVVEEKEAERIEKQTMPDSSRGRLTPAVSTSMVMMPAGR
jgi:RND family efflux transporter MFP subunit